MIVYVEHYEEDNFVDGGLTWQVGTGWPDNDPSDVWGTATDLTVHTQQNEATDSWNVTAYVNTAASEKIKVV